MRVRDPSDLRRRRRLRGLSQRDLAYLCRCSQAAISLLERGEMSSLSDELALSISNRLQVPWEELFDATSAVDHGPVDDGQADRPEGAQPPTGSLAEPPLDPSSGSGSGSSSAAAR